MEAMFEVRHFDSNELLGVFPEDELQQFDLRSWKIEQVQEKKELIPSLVPVHVEQEHLDEAGSKWRLEWLPTFTRNLRVNVRGQMILALPPKTKKGGGK